MQSIPVGERHLVLESFLCKTRLVKTVSSQFLRLDLQKYPLAVFAVFLPGEASAVLSAGSRPCKEAPDLREFG